MQLDLSHLSDLLEDQSDWVITTAGVLTALVVYAIFRTLLRFWRQLVGAPTNTPKKQRFLAFRLGKLFFHSRDDVIDMDALRNTPDGEYVAGEKRTNFRRRDTIVEILLAEAPGADPRRAWVVDRSTTGLGIVVKMEIPPGTIIGVRPTAAPPETPWVDVEVRSCAAQSDHWRLGCQFLVTPEWGLLLMFG